MNILVLGHSGTGKTSSINSPSSYDPEAKDYGFRLDPKETLMLVTHKKDLPFRGFKKMYTPLKFKDEVVKGKTRKQYDSGNYLVLKDFNTALKMINYCVKLPFKNIIIDDFQYLITNFIFEHAEEKGYDKYTTLAKQIVDLLVFLSSIDDKNIIVMSHTGYVNETETRGKIMKTKSGMVDRTVEVEGFFQYILSTSKNENGEFCFQTRGVDELDRLRTPVGLFELYEPLNLAYIMDKLEKFSLDINEESE